MVLQEEKYSGITGKVTREVVYLIKTFFSK